MSGTIVDPIVLSAVIGLGIAVALVAGLITWHKVILGAAKKAFKAVFTFNGFFWAVNLACMAYSAQNAGYIFGLYEASGLAIGLVLDGLIIVFTQTALTAKARGEMKRAAFILLFIAACCMLSTIGNLAHNLHTDISVQTSGVWFQQIVPYVTSLVPLLLIALAWVADLKIDPMEKEKPEVYKANENKRLQFRAIQIESREKQEALQTRVIAVETLRRRNSALRRGKVPGSFRWFWEKAVDAGEIVAGLSAQLKPLVSPQIEEMRRELETLRKEKEEFVASLEQMNAEKTVQFQQACQAFITQLIDEIRVGIHSENEQYRLALGQQYDQDITMVKSQLTNRIEAALSNLKTTISQDVDALNESFDLAIIATKKSAKSSNVIEMTSEVKAVVNRYPNVEAWLSGGERSVTLQDIIDATGHTSQLIHRRAKAGAFRATKRAGYYRLDSVITWLRTAPLPRPKDEMIAEGKGQGMPPITGVNSFPNTDQIGVIGSENNVVNGSDIEVVCGGEELGEGTEMKSVSQEDVTANSSGIGIISGEEMPSESVSSVEKSGDKLTVTMAAMRKNPEITDEELAVVLGLKRGASARFWKVKARTMLEQEQQAVEPSLEYATV